MTSRFLCGMLSISLAMGWVSCAGPSRQPDISTSQAPLSMLFVPDRFTVLTYNALHGLMTGSFGVAPGETSEQNEVRLQMLIRQLARVEPDVAFLQEVNPLPARAERYIHALRAVGLAYTEVHQVDACGVRVSEQRALFTGLNNGLVILAKEPLRLRKLLGLKLSGDLGRCQSTSGVQLQELRYALIGEIALPGMPLKYLVATTHLHSGLEAGTAFLNFASGLHGEGKFHAYDILRWTVESSQLRRIGELDRLIRTLNKLKREGDYAGIIFGGDLNFEVDHPEYEEMRLLRFADTSLRVKQREPLFTADPPRNRLIPDQATAPLPSSVAGLITAEQTTVQEAIIAAYRAEMHRPRQIDYLIEDSFLSGYCMTQTLFGQDMDDQGLPASDHFGLVNVYSRERVPCDE